MLSLSRDSEDGKYYFSVTDVIHVLTDQPDARGASTYWAVLMRRLKQEGAGQLLTNCKQLKLPAADGKNYKTDVADTEQILRIIQSVPSKKAEPFKQWLAYVGSMCIDQFQDPESSIEQAVRDYRRLGYSENWMNQRIKSIETRKELTDEWKRGGMQEGRDFALLRYYHQGMERKDDSRIQGLQRSKEGESAGQHNESGVGAQHACRDGNDRVLQAVQPQGLGGKQTCGKQRG